MRPPRGLSPEEQAAWARLAKTVTPMERRPQAVKPTAKHDLIEAGARTVRAAPLAPAPAAPRRGRVPAPAQPKMAAPPPSTLTAHGLDSSWERKLKGAKIEPDFTLDLHGHSLDSAHVRLDRGLAQAKAMGARLVLVVTGKARPVEAADRGERRGAIRAKVLDWLAAGPHGADIAAVRGAHRRHGGAGALYIVLRRGR